MKRLTMMMLGFIAVAIGMKAQVGYQIALLNTATGEARANETVTVSVSLSNNEGQVFYSETKSATTNDFGVLSLTIGNADTFKDVDLSKMPFFIEVTANGVLIGKSQILSVPVAEVAKQVAPIDKSLIVGTWIKESDNNASRETGYYINDENLICTYMQFWEYREKYEFREDGSGIYYYGDRTWTKGRLGYQGISEDKNYYERGPKSTEIRYSLSGDFVTISFPANYMDRDEYEGSSPVSYTYRSYPYYNIYLHYDKSTGILGDFFTKQ